MQEFLQILIEENNRLSKLGGVMTLSLSIQTRSVCGPIDGFNIVCEWIQADQLHRVESQLWTLRDLEQGVPVSPHFIITEVTGVAEKKIKSLQ